MPVALAIGGAALIGGAASVYSANKAASAQKKASQQAADVQTKQYEQTRSDLAPYRQFGTQSGNYLSDAYGFNGQAGQDRSVQNFRADPGYQYSLNQGLNAVEGSAAARGSLYSGATLKALQTRGQGMADQQYNNWLGRYQSGQTVGANASAQTGQFGQTAAQGAANAYQNAGNATANGYINTGNAINNTLGQAASAYGAYKGGAFDRPYQPPPPPSSVGRLPYPTM